MKDTRITRSSGNVFADLGLPNPEERLLKARLAVIIGKRIEQLGLSQSDAAKRMNIAQPDVSNILNGRLRGFSADRLISMILALGQDVEIKVKSARNREVGRLVMAGGG